MLICVFKCATTLRISYGIHIAVILVIPDDNQIDFRLVTEVVLDHPDFLPEHRYRSKPRRSQPCLPDIDLLVQLGNEKCLLLLGVNLGWFMTQHQN